MNSHTDVARFDRAALLKKLQEQGKAGRPAVPAQTGIAPVDRTQPLPLSWAQQRLWFLDQLDPAAAVSYNMPSALRLKGRLDRGALRRALDRIVARHECLRTSFVSVDGAPEQRIAPADTPFPLVETDLRHAATRAEREALAREHVETDAARPFDLGRAPLIRGELLQLDDEEHILLIDLHHIVSDGWSIGVLVNEFSSLYRAFCCEEPDPLPPLTVQYADYAAWQRRHLQGETLERQVAFWTRHLEGAPALLELPTDHPRPALQSHHGATVPFALPPELAHAVRAFSQRHGVTLFMTLLTAWAVLMARLSGQRDVVIGSPFANRQSRDTEALIGFFINTLAIRVRMDDDPDVATLLSRVKALTLDAYAHQDLPFEHVFEALQPVRSLAHSPIFQVMLALNNTPKTKLALPGLELETLPARRNSSYFDLSLFLTEGGGTVSGVLEYACALFEHASVERIAHQFTMLLKGMVADDRTSVARLPLLDQVDRRQLLETFNDSARPVLDGCLMHTMFERRAAGQPDAVAVIGHGERLTYGELNRRANRIAHRLIALGVRPDDRVAICIERGIDMVAGLLGILKAGGAYVPLDPAYPAERLAWMVEDSAPVALLAQAALAERLPVPAGLPVLHPADPALTQQPEHDPDPHALGLTDAHLCYIIYTSGSTGKPKGVMLEHRNVANLIQGHIGLCALTPRDRVMQFASISFDNSVVEIFPCLSAGATLVLRPAHVMTPDEDFIAFLAEHAITVTDLPTAFWHQWAQQVRAGRALPGPQLRLALAGGEKAELRHLRAWFAEPRLRGTRWINTYGPTEAAVNAAVLAYDGDDALPAHEIPIGRPVANGRIYILDTLGQPVPIGVPGEIHIGGAGVARGYLNRPELTAERFVDGPWGRVYKTGDLGRWLADGTIEYLGRNDFQVKLRGFRIELGEIEARLADCPGVREAVVVARDDGGAKRLVAYLLAEAGTLDAAALRTQLATALPEHMLPAAYVQLDAFPLNPSGKIDRKALPAPDQSAVAARAYAAPQGAVESTVAAIWQELLGLERVGRNDHFFELGGHSLMVVALIDRLRRHGLAASVRSVFATPVLHDLAAQLQAEAPPAPAVPPNMIPAGCTAITPDMLPLVALAQGQIDALAAKVPGGVANIQDIYPLAPLQQGILFHHLLDDAGDAYLLRSITRFDTRARLDACLAALQQVIDRHDSWRSAVHWHDLPQAVQVVLRHAPLPVHELDAVPDALAHLLERTDPRRVRLDLTRAPLLAATVVQDRVTGEWLMALLQHHIVTDHVTVGLAVREMRSILSGAGATLPPAIPYRDFVARALAVPAADHEAFFRAQLGDVTEPTAPFGVLDTQGDGARVREAIDTLPRALGQRLREAARRQGVSAAALFHVAWARVLAVTSERDDVVFGTTLSGRLGAPSTGHVFGMFINTLPVRISCDGTGVRQAVADTHRRLGALLAHEQASLALAQRCSGVPAPLPLFTTLLNYHHTAPRDGDWDGMRMLRVEERTNYPITVSVDDVGDDFHFITQCVDGIDPARINAYFATALASLADALDEEPEREVQALDVLPADEQARLLAQPASGFTPWLLHRRFEQQAAANPDAIAVTCEGTQLRYGELNRRANALAHRLIALGVGPDKRVALCVERGLDMLVGVLGILKAGGAYVPLDPVYPADRLAYTLEDCAPVALVTQATLRDKLDFDTVVLLDEACDGPDHNPVVPELDTHHLAYVIYTSGSTGQPKGVMVEHGHVSRLFDSTDAYFGFDERDVWTLFHSFAFDFSVWEIFGALLYGGRLVVVPALCARSPQDFHALLCREKVTVLNQTPTAFRQLIAADANSDEEHALRAIVFGGEALELHTLRPWIARHDPDKTRLINMYGITEITVHATYRPLSKDDILGDTGSVIGHALPDLCLHILDRLRRPVPVGVTGELYVGGAGVARGYLNRPELTAERFSNGFYKTGDLGRRLDDGSIEYLGRNDFQVKIRGFRIELGEIEAKLAACAGIQEAIVIAREDTPGDKRLVAYYTGEGEDLRAQLAAQLPEHMVPAAFVRLDAFPLTPNGKLDRKALPAPEQSALATRAFEPPQGHAEATIAAIWQELLGIERVGRNDHFFELGGHSLLVVGLIERLRRQNLPADVRTIFTAPTVAQLAAAITGRTASAYTAPANLLAPGTTVITPELLPLIALSQSEIDGIVAAIPGGAPAIQDIYPLAPLQEGILFHHLMESDGDAYLLRTTLAFESRARLDAFLAALQTVIDRHDVLRTSVHWSGLRQAVQVVQRHATLPVTELGAATHDMLLAATDPRRTRLDLTQAPLMAATTVEADGQWLLALLTHHLIDDNYTLQLILAEIKTILGGDKDQLPEPLPYRDFIAQVRSVPDSEHEAYFRSRLADVDEPTAPFGVLEADDIEETLLTLDAGLAARLRAAARQLGVTTAVLFHAAWAQVLAQCCGRDDVVFGTTLSGRLQGSSGADGVLGLFINTLPIRVTLAGRTARELVADTYQGLGELLAHEQSALALAQRCSGVHAPMPLFTSLLNYRHTRIVKGNGGGLPGVRVLNGEERTTYPVTISVNDLGDDFIVNAQCVPAIGARRIACYLRNALVLLADALDGNADVHASILPDDERRLVTEAFNDTAADYPRDVLLHQLVEAQAAARPDDIAVQCEDRTLTYGELNRRANRLAHRLIAQGVGPDDRVAISVERGLKMVVGLLGILKAGAAYVPIDPTYPDERIAFMLEDCAPAAVLTRDALADDPAWPDHDPHVPGLTARHLAYVIYTSGSTGKPKGAMNQHDAVVNRLLWARDTYGVGTADRVLQKTPFSFDVSVWEFFLPLLAGGRLVLARPEGHKDPAYLARLMTEAGITMLHFVPSMLTIFLEQAGTAAFPALRRVLCSGEALPYATQQRFAELLPLVELHNLYGPTEAAIDVTAWRCDDRRHAGKVPIGRPIANTQLYILDGQLRPVPLGAAGELHIGGIQVARGYLRRAELTAQRFVDTPYGRLYKTGDLGRWLPDGAIEYLGRNDFQVKIRGFRIELGEIEARLAACPGVRQAVVIAREDAGGDKQLIGYVLGDAGVAPQALHARLGEELPEHMVPGAIVVLDAFPLSPNGKLERRLLPDPVRASDAPFVAPRTATERTIAAEWMAVLNVDKVGVHDDFFAAGGHSLQAARLMFRLNGVLPGCQVGLLDFHRTPTIAALAALVDEGARREHTLLQELLPAGDGTTLTLVCCPYAGAAATVYRPLADALARRGAPVALYAVAVPGNEVGIDGGTAAALDSVEALAAACVREILATVPGPVALYGHCVGSNLALEITRRLELAGRAVDFLAVAGALPATMEDKVLMEEDIWAGVRDADIHALIRSWGGSAGPVEADALAFIIANFKKDSRMASRYEYARGDWTVRAPIHAIFGSADPLTPEFETRYLRWLEVSDTVHLAVVDGGHHYFVGDQPDAVAQILHQATHPAVPAAATEGVHP